MEKTVFVTGCFDMLHSGHVAFFKEASCYGKLMVGIGSDKTILGLKGRKTINSEQERLFMVKAVRYVLDAWINKGDGILDFVEDMKQRKPDIFIVNEDGHSPAKKDLCNELGIEYIVLQRIPEGNLPERSTTHFRTELSSQLPYRLDLAGTWIDQPMLSSIYPGWAITISLEPIIEYNERSGMATSTRNAAKKIWPYQLPLQNPETLAEILFRWENKPGNKLISGAQDSIGICVPGLCRHHYSGEYWPDSIEKIYDEHLLEWLENHLYMLTLWPRPDGTDLLSETYVTKENIMQLTKAADECWKAILEMNLYNFGQAFRRSFEAQVNMFPNMLNKEIQHVIEQYKDSALGWKLSGAGSGGYLVLVSDKPVENTMKLKIRRPIL